MACCIVARHASSAIQTNKFIYLIELAHGAAAAPHFIFIPARQ